MRAVVHSARPRAAAAVSPLVFLLLNRLATWPQRRGRDCPCPNRLDEIWDDIREELRSETADFKFHIWIEPLELAAVHGRTLYIRAPEHIRTSVAERYLPLLRRAAQRRFDERATVEVVGAEWRAPAERRPRPAPAAAPAGAARPT